MGVAEGVGVGEDSSRRGGIDVVNETGDGGHDGSGEERGERENRPLRKGGVDVGDRAGDDGRDASGEERGERENMPEVSHSAAWARPILFFRSS